MSTPGTLGDRLWGGLSSVLDREAVLVVGAVQELACTVLQNSLND